MSLVNYLAYWNAIFRTHEPLNHWVEQENLRGNKTIQKMDLRVDPEPYYGPLQALSKQDVVVLLKNPGAFSGDPQAANRAIQQRYRDGSPAFYRQDAIDNPAGEAWRAQRIKSWQRYFGQIGFLHTLEAFPLHSPRWPAALTRLLPTLRCTDLLLAALADVTLRSRMVIAFSTLWHDLLQQRFGQPVQVLTLQAPAFVFSVFRVTHQGQEGHIIHVRNGAGAWSLPRQGSAAEAALQRLIAQYRCQ